MKKLIIALAALAIAASSYAQGVVAFRNRVAGQFDAPIVLASDATRGAGEIPGMQAQLFLVGAGGALTALTPATTFAATTGAAAKYLSGKDVTIPGNTGTPATLRLRVFNGATYESSTAFGESADFQVTPGVAPNPPANLTGLGNTAISVTVVPEPSTIALGVLGLGALLLRRRK
jgi:hypothetical protein